MIKHILREIKYSIIHVKYLLLLKKRNRIHVYNSWETIEYIIKHRCSLSRFGDGELNMIYNFQDGNENQERVSGFQVYDESLGKRLMNILAESGSSEVNHIIGLPGCMFNIGTAYLKRNAAVFWELYTCQNIDRTLCYLKKNIYLDTNFTRFYLSYRNKSQCRKYIEKVKEIWQGRELIIVEGLESRLGVGNDLFDKAKSVKRILCPTTNAWNMYQAIFDIVIASVRTKDTLVLCALGMTATVLSRDLAHQGIQSIDLGHIDIEYEWMLSNVQSKVPIKGKYTNETAVGKIVEQVSDATYKSQIIHILR